MLWLIDLTAARENTSGINTWAVGALQGIRELDVPDRWAVLGTSALPALLREAARDAGAQVFTSPRHRGIVQQIELPRLARRLGADGLLAVATVLPLWRRGVPATAVLHDFRHLDEPERYGTVTLRYRTVMYRHAVRRAERLVSISADTARAALREDPTAGSRTLIAHHGADHVDGWRRPPREHRAIAFAHWPNKEPRTAISAWARAVEGMEDPPVLHVVGVPAAERAGLVAHIETAGASDVVTLRGRLDDAEYRPFFASSALVLLPSSAEGLGLPVVEAMRLGIPIVASDLPSIREVSGEYAWYAAPGDVEGFASAIRSALAASPERIAGAQQHAGQFTWRRCAEVLHESLVLAASRNPRAAGRGDPPRGER